MRDWTVGVDIGGTKIEAIVVDGAGRRRGVRRRPTASQSSKALFDCVTTTIYETLAAANVTLDVVKSLGVGVPGQVDPDTGTVRLAVNLHLQDYPLGARLAARMDRAVVVENDIRLATLGVYRRFPTTTVRHLAYVGIGTGVAAGIILDGKLHRGAHGLAGEIGHMIVEPDGDLCNCGNRGCLETILSGPAILRRATAVWPADEPPPESVAAVFAAAATHPTARCVVDRAGTMLAHILYWLVLTYDVDTIVLGGGVSRAGAALLRPVNEEITRRANHSPLAALLLNHDKIQLLPPDFNAGAWGAVWLARRQNGCMEASMR